MKLAIIGTGNMGKAILAGILAEGIFDSKDINVCDVRKEAVDSVCEKYGTNGFTEAAKAVEGCDYVLMAVKPIHFDAALSSLKDSLKAGVIVLSIAAAVKCERIKGILGEGVKFVRIMPNTPAMINMAVATVCSKNKNSKYYSQAIDILNSIGKCYEIDEKYMDATVPLNGSMPAYLELFAKAFIDKAIRDGIDPDVAKKLVCESIISSANLILKSDEPIEQLIKNVCSKGGTTLAGLDKLYEYNFEKAIYECSEACKNRSSELKR